MKLNDKINTNKYFFHYLIWEDENTAIFRTTLFEKCIFTFACVVFLCMDVGSLWWLAAPKPAGFPVLVGNLVVLVGIIMCTYQLWKLFTYRLPFRLSLDLRQGRYQVKRMSLFVCRTQEGPLNNIRGFQVGEYSNGDMYRVVLVWKERPPNLLDGRTTLSEAEALAKHYAARCGTSYTGTF